MNWRETRFADTALVALLPCKPDAGARTVPLGGRDVSLHMTGCDAGSATFAVAHATVDAASAAPAVLAQWRTATLANMVAVSSRDVPLNAAARSVLGSAIAAGPASSSTSGSTSSSASSSSFSSAATAPMRVTAEGRRKDGSAVTMQALWFAKDAQVFHAVVYAERTSPDLTEAVETFFSGLKFQ